MITGTVDWRADLGGGFTVALIQAGTFTSDAGTVFGPVPRTMWQRLVEAELNPDHTLTQALNCLLVETPAGRVLVETGIGERQDERRRQQRGMTGAPILPALRAAGFEPATVDLVALSHLHFDHAGGLLTADGERAFSRARIVAQADEWDFALGSNLRLQASYEQADLRLAEPWARPTSAAGDEEVMPGVSVVRTGGHSGGHQAVVVRGGAQTVGFFGDLCMRPWSTNPRWVPSFDDFPLTSVEVKESLFRRAAEEGWTVVLSHEPRRPVGRLKRDGSRYVFDPLI
ncbi:MAG TPA: MBL fold metallo-hydrolase, partial [Candidatus Limnocylindria bacterium]|nr:MBL fold metallo-hydrolase [Candidatus Limnocylindria bacterium]